MNVQAGVYAMMLDNSILDLPNPVTVPTSDMTHFPDLTQSTSKVAASGAGFQAGDGAGWVLYEADVLPDALDRTADRVNYVGFRQTICSYIADRVGTVTAVGDPSGC